MNKIIDPLQNRKFKSQGFIEDILGAILGRERPLECAQIEVTSFCQGGCSYCPHGQKEWQYRHMSAETFASLWPVLRKARRAHLQGWGEPLLQPRFFDFVSFAQKAGCTVSTTTCGLYIDEDIAYKLNASHMDAIGISLAGCDAESNSVRAKTDFDRICANIKLLRQMQKEDSPSIHLAYLLLADRPEQVLKLPALMAKLDVATAVISTLDFIANERDRALAYSPEDSGKLKSVRKLLEKAASNAREAGRVIYYELPDPKAKPKGGCRENAAANIYIDAEGNISPCVYLNVPAKSRGKVIFGNSLAANPWEVWNKREYAQFRANLQSRDIPPACASCPKHSECA